MRSPVLGRALQSGPLGRDAGVVVETETVEMDKIAASIAHIAAEAAPDTETGRGTAPVELPPALSDALDAWIADQPGPKPSRSEAIRHAMTDWLTRQGYVCSRVNPGDAI